MSMPSKGRLAALEIRAFYSVAELARAAGVPSYKLLRLLRRCHVAFIHAGRAHYVPLSEIREKIPPLWQSLCSAQELRRACDGAAVTGDVIPRTAPRSSLRSVSRGGRPSHGP
jgi:hypothetical protein